MLVEVLASFPILLLIYMLFRKDTEPLLGVYAQPGKWHFLKVAVFKVMLWLRERKSKKSTEEGIKDGSGYGQKSHRSACDMEKPQTLLPDAMALDAAYFNGLDKNGTVFILRLGRRHNRETEIWLSIDVPGMGFYQYPNHPDTRVYNTDPNTWNAGGLKFECLEPMRRWKVTFNGLLRKGLHNEWTKEKGELVHVKFSFIWEAFTSVFDFDTDLDHGAIADAIAREKWTSEFWNNLKSRHQTHYEQWGMMRGMFKVEGEEERYLVLRGTRDHSYGVRDWRSFHRYVVHFGMLENGTAFHVNTICLPCTTSYLQCGYHSFPNAVMVPVQKTDINLSLLGENVNPPDQYEFNYTAGGKKFHCVVSAVKAPKYYHHDDWGSVIFEKFCKFTVNGIKGYGITEFIYRNKSGCPVEAQDSVPLLAEPAVQKSDESCLTLAFTKPACCSASLVGGKGCQLAFLTQLPNAKDYIVPKGFCLTIAAFNLQLTKCPNLEQKVEKLEKICSMQLEGNIKKACEELGTAFTETPVCDQIQQVIAEDLIRLFHTNHSELQFAVRSSAAGEDSAEMSAAGQMDTILGVKGIQQIFDAVAQCWSSHFSFPAVEYRRQHGQPINSSMGVVIQEMVKAHSAGVLFTRDALNGNPGKMVVNANYGLGESVVSGGSEPDQIIILRSWDDSVSIGSKEIGSKKSQIRTTEMGGTMESETSTEEAKKCCVEDEHVLQLAKIGIQLEKAFGDPRDIEFAVSDGQIYLLQARPITTLDTETEYDLIHEFDSPAAADTERFTSANIQEMMPGAVTPLTYSTFIKGIEIAGQDVSVKAHVYDRVQDNLLKFMAVVGNSAFLNVHYMMSINENTVASSEKRMAELAILGETLEDFTIDELNDYHGVAPAWKKIKRAFHHWKNMLGAPKRSQRWEGVLQTYSIAQRQHDSASHLYRDITAELPRYYECWGDTICNSANSGMWSTILMATVTQRKSVWTREHFSDVAMLLAKCEDVYSADVPSALQNVAQIITNSDKRTEFISLSEEEAVQWLKSSKSELAGKRFAEFLQRHGHRCIREAEFREKSWQSEPVKVVRVLQAMLQMPQTPAAGQKSGLGVKESIAKLKSSTTALGRLILRWVLKKSRSAVGLREWGKSLSIKMVEVFKLAYWKLAKMLVNEGRLPDEDLMFFLTHGEIGKLLEERSGRLVARAQKRRRVHPKQNQLSYHRLNIGLPKPVEEGEVDEEFVITSLKLSGMPVSCGVVRGTARVVRSLAEASYIEQGDILIVHYTDVGWSPYFPMISGLVTEIGGLLSHGAVVAREYGIPCVVNMHKATSLIKSGDQVLLNGTKGTLEKLEE